MHEADLRANGPDRLLRLPEVLRMFPISRSAWYQGVAEGRYRAPYKLSARAVAWRQSEVEALMGDAVTTRLQQSRDDASTKGDETTT